MKKKNKINELFRKRAVRCIAGIVAFSTTYSLVLPAITIDQETAEEDPGIVLTEEENVNAETTYTEPEVIVQEEPEPVEEVVIEETPEPEPVQEPEPEPVAEEKKEEPAPAPEEEKKEPVQEEKAPVQQEPKQQENAGQPEEETIINEEKELLPAAGELSYESKEDYVFKTEYDESLGLTEKAKLEIQEIYKEEEYKQYLESFEYQYEEELKKEEKETDNYETAYARFFNVYFLDNNAYKEIKGKTKNTYTFHEPIELEDNEELKVCYIDKEGKFQEYNEEDNKLSFKYKDKENDEEKDKVEEITFEDKEGLNNFTIVVIRTTEEETTEQKEEQVTEKTETLENTEEPVSEEQTEEVTGEPKEAVEEETENPEEIQEEETYTSGSFIEKGKGYTITLDYSEDAKIPEGSRLFVREIIEDSKTHNEYLTEAEGKVENISYARFFDISILNKEGNEIEPSAAVDVRIIIDDAPESDDIKAIHFTEEETQVIDTEKNEEEVTFTTESFSVYGVIYTVDFHYEVNGKTYDFSMPGGGFVSFYNLVEVLGIGSSETNRENGIDDVIYKNVDINSVVISESTREFVSNVEDIRFSNPDLMWIHKIDNETTVSQLKDDYCLDVVYSADLTDDQIADINDKVLQSGDWALLSLRPFTTEEILTVFMKNGEYFSVKVTDKQQNTIEAGNRYLIYYTSNGQNYVLKNDGTVSIFNNNDAGNSQMDLLGDEYLWTFEQSGYGWNVHSGSVYLALGSNPSNNNTVISSAPISDNYFNAANDGGFQVYTSEYVRTDYYGPFAFPVFQNYYFRFDTSSNRFVTDTNSTFNRIKLWQQTDRKFNFTVKTEFNNVFRGTVSGKDYNGNDAPAGGVASYVGITKNGKNNYTNNNRITAIAGPGYVFDHWELNGQVLEGDAYSSSVIESGTLPFPQDNMILTAVFEKDGTQDGFPDYADLIDQWKQENMPDPITVEKTAEVYDYDNRIYEIDIKAKGETKIVSPDIELVFIADISRSMYFPAAIEQIGNKYTVNNNNVTNLIDRLEALYNNSNTRRNVYYLMGNAETDATLYAVRRTGNRSWQWIDASFDATDRAKKGSGQQSFVNLTNTSNPGLTKGKTMNGIIYEATDTSYRLDYLQQAIDIASDIVYTVNPQSKVGLVTFAKSINNNVENADKYGFFDKSEYNQLINDTNNVTPEGGTNQYAGLVKAKEFWTAEPDEDHQRAVIMITDGAPNVTTSGFSDRNQWWKIQQPADDLKNPNTYDATIFTVGLSLGDVVSAEAGLRDHVASPGYAFSAPTGRDLVQKILQIIDTLFTEVELYGSVRDVLDPAFYPVDSDGEPLSVGYYNDDGEKIEGDTLAYYINNNLPYHLWMSGDENWTVTWYNEHIGEGTNTDPAFHQSILVKTKEDFLGGNTISTNSGEAQVTATTYIEKGDATRTRKQLHTSLSGKAATPYVNIDELVLNENETEWTVYLGTEVDPLPQLKELFKKISFRQVVTEVESGLGADLGFYSYRLKTGEGSLVYELDRGAFEDDNEVLVSGLTPSAMPLVEVLHYLNDEVSWTDLSNAQWTRLINGEELIFKYYGNQAYGHGTEDDPVGVIKLKLTQETATGEPGLPDAHETVVTNEENDNKPVEKYNLKVTYTPTGPKAVEYNTGTYVNEQKQPGVTTDTVTSENKHQINVYGKTIEVEKRKPAENDETALLDDKPATFSIYRKWKESDGTDKKKSLAGYTLNGTALAEPSTDNDYYYLVESKQTEDGIAKFTVGLSSADDPYYLAETIPPQGYMGSKALQTITITPGPDNKTDLDGETTTTMPYDWTQGVSFYIDGSGTPAIYVNESGTQIVPTTGAGARTYVLPDDAEGWFKTSMLNEPLATLRLKKQVTIHSFAPDSLTGDDKTLADGIYEINITGTENTPTEGKSYTAKITITNGEAASATIKDNTVPESTDTPVPLTNGAMEISDMIPGEYTITEEDDHKTALTAANSDSDTTAVTDLPNRMITIHLGGSTSLVQLVTLTNNYESNSDEDIAHVSVRKTFKGLKLGDKLPENFQIKVKVTATIDGRQKEFNYTLKGATDTANGVVWNQSVNADGDVVWDWKIAIKGLQPDAQVEVREENYSKPGYTVSTSGNPTDVNGDGTSYTGTVSAATIIDNYHIDRVITQKNESEFPVYDTGGQAKIFIARLNGLKGNAKYPLIITRKQLSLSERAYLEDKLRTEPFSNAEYWLGDPPNKPLYYSFDQAANNMLIIRGQRVTYSEIEGNPTSGKINFLDQRQWTMVAETTITYKEGRPADFNFVNSYTEKSVGIDIVKVDKENRTTKLPGAKFTLTQLDETTTSGSIVYKKIEGTNTLAKQVVSDATDSKGETSFSNLTKGYYEIKETQMPAGYILRGDGCIYVKIEDGVASYLLVNEDETVPITEWAVITETEENDMVQVTAGRADDGSTAEDETLATSFSIGNEPGEALPNTGGTGTLIFYVFGLLLTSVAGIGLIFKRHKSIS